MTFRARIPVVGLAAVVGIAWIELGCTGESATVVPQRDVAALQTLTGAWDVTLTLEHPYPLGFSDPTARRVCGTIGFVEGKPAKTDASGWEANGVYRIPLPRLGLDWLDDAGFPTAIATQTVANDNAENPDSVSIVLNPQSKERIELDGIYKMAGISGNWTAQSARGTASGAFTLRRHAPVGDSSC